MTDTTTTSSWPKVLDGLLTFFKFLLFIPLFWGSIEMTKWVYGHPWLEVLAEYPLFRNIGAGLLVAIGFQLLLFAGLLLQTRWRKPTIFLSHKGELFAKAQVLRDQLEAHGFTVFLLPFSTSYTHDHVVAWVRDHIRKSDAMVVVPDANKASFVDAEILAASVKGIPIVVMQHTASQVQPSTLLRGFPVFDFERIQADQAVALKDYLLLSIQHRRDLWRNLRRHFSLYLYVIGLGALLMIALTNFFTRTIWNWITDFLFSYRHTPGDPSSDPVLTGVFAGMFIIAMFMQFLQNRKNLQITRQSAITGIKSIDEFTEAFTIPSDQRILAYLNRNDFRPLGSD